MSRVTYKWEWVVSHMNRSCQILWINHVKYVWVSPNENAFSAYINKSCLVCVGIPKENESCHVWMSRVKYEWVKSNMCRCPKRQSVMSRMNESCQIWMSQVKYVWVSPNKNASCPYINESCLVCVGVPKANKSCHVWMSRVTYEWVTSNMCGYPQIRMPHVHI